MPCKQDSEVFCGGVTLDREVHFVDAAVSDPFGERLRRIVDGREPVCVDFDDVSVGVAVKVAADELLLDCFFLSETSSACWRALI